MTDAIDNAIIHIKDAIEYIELCIDDEGMKFNIINNRLNKAISELESIGINTGDHNGN